MRLAMTILVRDAEDLIETNLRYHRAQGVDLFLIGDNGSTDRTLEILEPYREAGLVELYHIEGDARHAWSAGRTMLARKAYELGADWVVHDDHDEFWWPLTGTLKDALAAIPERFGLASAPRTEFVARPGEEFWPERLTVREARFRRPPKIVHRTHPQVRIRQPHPVDIWIDHGTSPRDGLVGRPVRRAREAHSEATELELLLAPNFSIGVLHFPVRSLKQYTRLVGLAVANGDLGRDEEHAQGARRLPGRAARGHLPRDGVRGRRDRREHRGRAPGGGHRLSRLPASVPGSAERQKRDRGRWPTCSAGRRSGASASWRSSRRTACTPSAATCRRSPIDG